jgi:hypothetical protein
MLYDYENDDESVSPSVSHDDKENSTPSASYSNIDAVIENDDASTSEAVSRTRLEACVLSKRKKETS